MIDEEGKDRIKYLGVTSDKKFLFKHHIERAKNNATVVQKMLYQLKRTNSGKSMENK